MEEKEIDGYKATELIASGVITSNDIANGILYDEIKNIEIEILEYKDNNFKTKDSRIIPVNWLNVGKKQLIIVNPSEYFINKI